MQAQPVADMEQAARVALTGLRPAFEKCWRWQRWTGLTAASAAGAGAATLICNLGNGNRCCAAQCQCRSCTLAGVVDHHMRRAVAASYRRGW